MQLRGLPFLLPKEGRRQVYDREETWKPLREIRKDRKFWQNANRVDGRLRKRGMIYTFSICCTLNFLVKNPVKCNN